MGKSAWNDHPLMGKQVSYGDQKVPCTVVGIKAGPCLVDTSTFDQPEAKIEGTIKLQLKMPGGHKFWTAPMKYEEPQP